MICADQDCNGQAVKRGLCDKHYLRFKRAGRLGELPPSRRGQRPGRIIELGVSEPGKCQAVGCSAPAFAQGYCRNDYLVLRRRGVLKTDKLSKQKLRNDRTECILEGCDRAPRHDGLCISHYHRKIRYGDPSFIPERTRNIGKPKTNRAGYRLIYRPDHPDAHANGYVLEHRLVIEDAIGRRLLPNETVHHKNGNRADNRPENLELWLSSQPSGQRVTDLVEHAKAILALYPPSLLTALTADPASRGAGQPIRRITGAARL